MPAAIRSLFALVWDERLVRPAEIAVKIYFVQIEVPKAYKLSRLGLETVLFGAFRDPARIGTRDFVPQPSQLGVATGRLGGISGFRNRFQRPSDRTCGD